MFKRTDTIVYNGRTFEVVTGMDAGFDGAMAVAHIYEVVRPNWRFFRTRWLDSKSFFVYDYPTIADGVLYMVERVIAEEAEDEVLHKKWTEFVNK